MIWAGSPFAQLIQFSTGLPTGAISFQLRDTAGNLIHSGAVNPEPGALSHLLVINGNHNNITAPLIEARTLSWEYTTETSLVSDRTVYKVRRQLPFPVSEDGVRNQLGVAGHELRDEAINLSLAYAEFANLVPTDQLAAAETSGDRLTLLVIDGIEAMAALMVLPTIQLRAGQLESNGTNQFSRFREIDWEMLKDELQKKIDRARIELDPLFTSEGASLNFFGTAPRQPDPLTGT